jgi:mannose-6-phosphate isomerase-like protein (cupin superfamily)
LTPPCAGRYRAVEEPGDRIADQASAGGVVEVGADQEAVLRCDQDVRRPVRVRVAVRYEQVPQQTPEPAAMLADGLAHRVVGVVPPHVHTREDEYSIVTEGEIGFRSGDREVVLGAGGYITKPRGELHAMWNVWFATNSGRCLSLVPGDHLEPGAKLGSVTGEGGLQRIEHRLTAGRGPDPKTQPLVDLVDLEREEGTAPRLLGHECLDVLSGLGRELNREGQAIPSNCEDPGAKGIQLVDPLLESGRVDGASEVDRFHGALLRSAAGTVGLEVNFKSRGRVR